MQATFRAGCFRVDDQRRPSCGACGKVAMHCRVAPVQGEVDRLGIWCTRCGKCFATIAGVGAWALRELHNAQGPTGGGVEPRAPGEGGAPVQFPGSEGKP